MTTIDATQPGGAPQTRVPAGAPNAAPDPIVPIVADALDIDALEAGRFHRVYVNLGEDGAAQPLRVPVLVARGARPGPVVGITAALHGNEVNGIPTIHRLFRTIDPADLAGTVVGVPITNIPGYLAHRREYRDGKDLNRLMPGRPQGSCSEVYAHRLFDRVVRRFGYSIDLHTASFGRINSLYVRADMDHPHVAEIARLLRPQIIVHNKGGDGTLRAAAQAVGIHALTVEVGDPQRFQEALITSTRIAIRDVLEHLQMLPDDHERSGATPVECSRSYWLYTDAGGILEVFVKVARPVEKGERVAHLSNEWGDVVRVYHAPEDGVVVGKSTNPVADTGARIIHLGVVGPPPAAKPDASAPPSGP